LLGATNKRSTSTRGRRSGLTKGSTISTTEDLRKDDVIEVRKLHLEAGGLSNDELAIVTGGGSIRIVCDDHKVIGTRPK
jgi:hypothetical protein